MPPERINALKNIEGVAAVSHTLEELAILKYGERRSVATIKGVDAHFEAVSGVDTSMRAGDFVLQYDSAQFAVLGWGIEYELGVELNNPFERLQVFMPKRGAKAAVNPDNVFNVRSIMPAGVFSVQEEFDRKYVFVPISFARDLMQYNGEETSFLEIALQDNANSDQVQAAIQAVLGDDFVVKNRYQQDEFLYKVMQTEKWAVYFILTLILILASFNIIGSLSMLAIEKKKDVGILRAMGSTLTLIRNIFLAEGFLLCLSGGLLGMLMAWILCVAQQRFGFIKIGGDNFLVDAYPVSLRLGDFVLVFATLVVIAIAASLYPALKAARQSNAILEK
ncbi:MAG: ABC transporter permease [Sphingobacteriales bacterium]|nr:ABC transporter permease [Sphingobacteriales bacterium]